MTEAEEVDKFVGDLIAEQRCLDEQTRLMAQEIVDNRKLETLEEAKQFAANWIETAAQHARNEEYWRGRARAAEATLAATTRPDSVFVAER